MEKMRAGESQKREDAGARTGRTVAKHCVFPMFCGSGGSKSRLAKAAGAEPASQMKDELLHAIVAQSAFGSEQWQNTSASEHFWKLRCRKSAHRCGAKMRSTFSSQKRQSTKIHPLARSFSHSMIHINIFQPPFRLSIFPFPFW